jgi:hypothetical protein
MTRDDNFVFRVSEEERNMIAALAQRLKRTESDAVRHVVIEVARALETTDTPPDQATQPTTPAAQS